MPVERHPPIDKVASRIRPLTEQVSAPMRLTWLLVVLSVLCFEVAAADGERTAVLLVGLVAGMTLSMMAGHLIVRHFEQRSRSRGHATAPASESSTTDAWHFDPTLTVLLLTFVPLIAEIAIRIAIDAMIPLELVLLSGFRNAVLVLGAFANRGTPQRMACALSTFLTIFSSALSHHIWLHGIVVVFAIIGIWWLMGSYWESLQDRLAASSQKTLSRRWIVALPLVVLMLLIVLPVAATQTHALRGFMPSSGGKDWYDPSARSGVGDGDALVAGTDNIQSFGPIEDAPFLNSHQPSLYDLFDDSYSEPVKPKDSNRAIPLPKTMAANQKEHHIAESKRAGREFSTLRKTQERPQKKIRNLDTDALFFVKGRVPLHLKQQTYDLYDGIDWHPSQPRTLPQKLTIRQLHNRPWLWLGVPDNLDIYARPETHALRMAGLDTNRIPLPTETLGIHIDKVDRDDMFEWAQPDIVRMNVNKIPPLTVVQLQSRVASKQLIAKSPLFWSSGPEELRQTGDDFSSRQLQNLAHTWTRDIPEGWPQVCAIVATLREHYVHDDTERPPADCIHTAAHFLLASKRGPDYQFASAAVVLLRSLGISARVVSGFYADPLHYDRRTRQTAVSKHDVHFWAEVFVGGGHWIPIEPTPGYELLSPPPTWLELGEKGLRELATWIVNHHLSLGLSLALLATTWMSRRRLSDLIATVVWSIKRTQDSNRFTLATLRLLEGRFRRCGLSRPRSLTPIRWLRTLAMEFDEPQRQSLFEFLRVAERVAYQPQAPRHAVASSEREHTCGERTVHPSCPSDHDSSRRESTRTLCLAVERACRWQVVRDLTTRPAAPHRDQLSLRLVGSRLASHTAAGDRRNQTATSTLNAHSHGDCSHHDLAH